ncbi:MAG: hypothetical protein L6R41_005489 [Letrouitia leprolyta]|nr:MAG: hypothetical protein L6R41_005489 [Letrouitia leprolyta]
MSKSQGSSNKGGSSNSQKHLHSRVSYLYRAASYLAGAPDRKQAEEQNICKQAVAEPTQSQGNQGNQQGSNPSVLGNVLTQTKENTINPTMQTETQSTMYDEASVRLMLSHVQGISRKSLFRLPSSMKHSICRRCHVLLVNERNSTQWVENPSRGGKKPWANVLVITCNACETARHFPIGAKRQPRKKDRPSKGTNQTDSENIEDQK